MMNHRIPAQVKWGYDDGRKGFVVKALEDISRGQQIHYSYGNKDNSSFLLNYGFLPPGGDNKTLLMAYCDPDDPNIEDKEKLC